MSRPGPAYQRTARALAKRTIGQSNRKPGLRGPVSAGVFCLRRQTNLLTVQVTVGKARLGCALAYWPITCGSQRTTSASLSSVSLESAATRTADAESAHTFTPRRTRHETESEGLSLFIFSRPQSGLGNSSAEKDNSAGRTRTVPVSLS